MKLTKWISGDVKPTRDGVYQRDYGRGNRQYCRYSRGKWRMGALTVIRAADESEPSTWQELPWRGLAEDPKAKSPG